MRKYILLFLLFLSSLALTGQDESSIGQVTVLMQDKSKLTGTLESEQPNKVELNIDGEMYVLKKKNIIAIIPSEILGKSLENGVLKKDLILLNSKVWISGDVLEIDSKIVYFKTNSATHILKSKEVNKIYLKGQKISLLARTNDEGDFMKPLLISKLKRQYTKEGFYHIVYGNLVFDTGLGAQYHFGYQLTKTMGLGLGVGYFDSSNSLSLRPKLIPIFAETRGYLSNRKTSAYYNLAIGLTTGTKFLDNVPTKVSPGIYTHPAIGYKIGSDKVAFLIDIGIQISSVEYEFDSSELALQPISTEVFETNNLVLRLGIMF
jgi:hypothetical protein